MKKIPITLILVAAACVASAQTTTNNISGTPGKVFDLGTPTNQFNAIYSTNGNFQTLKVNGVDVVTNPVAGSSTNGLATTNYVNSARVSSATNADFAATATNAPDGNVIASLNQVTNISQSISGGSVTNVTADAVGNSTGHEYNATNANNQFTGTLHGIADASTNFPAGLASDNVVVTNTINAAASIFTIKDNAGLSRFGFTPTATFIRGTNSNISRIYISGGGDTVFYDSQTNIQLRVGTGGMTGNAAGLTNVQTAAAAVVATNAPDGNLIASLVEATNIAQSLGGGVSATNVLLLAKSNLFFYVDCTNGIDSATGLSPSTAWKTISNAVQWVSENVSFPNHSVTLQLTNGTYNEAVNFNPRLGGGKLLINGNPANSNLVVWAGGAGAMPTIQTIMGNANVHISNLTLKSSNAIYCIAASNGGTVSLDGGIVFGSVPAGGSHMVACCGGVIAVNGDYAITAGAVEHVYTLDGGYYYSNVTNRISLYNTPAFSAYFAEADENSVQEWLNTAFSGSATGKRFKTWHKSFIRTSTGGTADLPGDASGSYTNGGQYNLSDSVNNLYITSGLISLVANKQGLNGISPTGSPFTFTNIWGCNIVVHIYGGAYSAVTINGTTMTFPSTGYPTTWTLQAGETLTVAYTSAPTIFWKAQ